MTVEIFSGLLLVGLYVVFFLSRLLIARVLYFVAFRTESIYVDLIVDRLRPFRFAWLIPLFLLRNNFSNLSFELEFLWVPLKVALVWLGADLFVSLLNGLNDIYRNNPRYQGVSAAGYIGMASVATVIFAAAYTISVTFNIAAQTLIAGVGAWLAVLILIFRDTILSFLASVQLSTQKLIKEGDAIEVPAYGASGIVSNIELQTLTVKNFDNTTSTIPTGKILDTGFKNERRQYESGARRIKQALLIDAESITFTDKDLLRTIKKSKLENEFSNKLAAKIHQTNLNLFIEYAEYFLRQKPEIRADNFPMLVRTLPPTPNGVPLELYAFVVAPTWEDFQKTQTEIMVHLIASLSLFKLLPRQAD